MEQLMKTMKKSVKYWWISLIIGLLSLGLGIWALAAPAEMLIALVFVFVAGFIVSGLVNIFFSISNRHMHGWGWSLVSGLIDIAIAAILLAAPEISIFLLIFYVGFWILLQSFWGFTSCYEMKREEVKGWGWILAMSIFNLILGIILISNPSFAAEFIVMLAALSFIMYGITRTFYAFKLKSYTNMIDN